MADEVLTSTPPRLTVKERVAVCALVTFFVTAVVAGFTTTVVPVCVTVGLFTSSVAALVVALVLSTGP